MDRLEEEFADIAKRLKEEKGYSSGELARLIPGTVSIPATIFDSKLSPLRSLVSYMKNDTGMELSDIANTIRRSYRAVWGAYQKESNKAKKTDYFIPADIFNDKHSILESAVTYLRDTAKIRPSKIARILGKSQSTITTAYRRAREKA